MDFLGNIFLGIRIFDWILLFFVLTISARVFGVRDSLHFLETKVSELWIKLVKDKEYQDKPYVPFSDTGSDTDEIIPESDKKEEPKKEKKESTFIGTTFKILFAIVGFIVIVGIVNTYK